MALSGDLDSRLHRALHALEGLSVGDAFGQCFFAADREIQAWITERQLPPGPWRTTDDTEMATAIVDVLAEDCQIAHDRLAFRFAERFGRDSSRGYGAGAFQLLSALRAGVPWTYVSRSLFEGQGSMGNGAAMRVAPLGAYFADDLELAITQARISAEITHAHPDGIAGAIAVAVAAAWAASPALRAQGSIFGLVLERTPAGPTCDGLRRAASLPEHASVELAKSALGAGHRVLSSDTVPFALWCAARHLDDFEEAMWRTVSVLGDRDTTCAIAGGIVALACPPPRAWLDRREPLRFDTDAARKQHTR